MKFHQIRNIEKVESHSRETEKHNGLNRYSAGYHLFI